jgi:uncharacterized protein
MLKSDPDESPAAVADAPPPPAPEPVRLRDRVSSVDVLRGVALLGILLMNIVGMGLPHWAYDHPTIAGNRGPADFWAWAINAVLFEGKMRTIFSMLFGAGVILITSRAETRGAGQSIADIHLRRNVWLVLFGMIHGYLLLWPGDILYVYGVAGIPLFVQKEIDDRLPADREPDLAATLPLRPAGMGVAIADLPAAPADAHSRRGAAAGRARAGVTRGLRPSAAERRAAGAGAPRACRRTR